MTAQSNKTAKRILAIEDTPDTRELIGDILTAGGYTVELAKDGPEGLQKAYAFHPDLILLDIRMPGMDGWEVLERLRELSDVPVIMLTGLDQEPNIVKGLQYGADDYVTKPFGVKEIIARIEAVLRRSPGAEKTEATTQYSDIHLLIDFKSHQVYMDGVPVSLSPQEYRLLGVFARNPGTVLSVDQLGDQAWGLGATDEKNVRVYVGYLRSKLEGALPAGTLFETVRGFGYKYIGHT